MPKSNFLRKKSSTGATADFKRLKAKVGKRAPQAASHTDTSFKSKRVRVSAQSILHDLGDADAVTARGQGVQELIVQLRHYNSTSKRDALAGLKTIVDRHRTFAEVNFARLAEASLELAVCFDNEVRRGLLAFQESLLSCVSAGTFSPFANLYMAYVVSAMTSLDGGVRRDSLRLLALLLARFPEAVADRAERLAPNYATLLAVDPASKKQTSRSEALQSLVRLFRAVSLRYGRGGGGGGGSDSGGHSVVGGKGLGSVRLSWKRGSRRNGALMLCARPAPATTESAVEGSGGGAAGSDAPTKALAFILPQMLARLKEVWMEALAAVPPDIGLMQSVVDVLLEAIASPAWTAADSGGGGDGPQDGVKVANSGSGGGGGDRAAMVSWRGDEGHRGGGAPVWFSQFVPLILEAFPVRPLEGELLGDAEAERLRAIQALNMGLCELVVAACTGSAEVAAGAAAVATTSAGAAGKRVGEGESPSDWLTPVLAHVHDVLQSGVGGSGMAEPQVTSVLRVLRAATHNSTGKSSGIADWTAQRQRLLAAFGDFFESLLPRDEAKVMCVKFVCSLTSTLLPGSTPLGGGGGRTTVGDDPDAAREVCRWLQLLPELLCRWEGELPESSAAALGALLGVAKHAPSMPQSAPGTSDSTRGDGRAKGKTAAAAVVAVSGGTGGAGGAWASASSELIGSISPALLGEFFSGRGFLALPPSAQLDAVSLLFHLPSVPACVVSALAAACSDPEALRGDVRSFVLEVMHHRRRSFSPSAYLGFLVGVLTGYTGPQPSGRGKRTAIQAGGVGAGGRGRGGGGKRQRQKSAALKINVKRKEEEEEEEVEEEGAGVEGEGEEEEGEEEAEEMKEAEGAAVAPANLWKTVFGRDEVTGAACSSLAMIGTRGAVLLEALRPTLLQLLRPGCGRGGSGGREKPGGSGSGGGNGGVTHMPSLDEGSLAAALQGQRAAMACVLCCWEGLEVECAAAPTTTRPESPLTPLERPMAAACVWAMKTAGTAEAAEDSRGARLLRPVIVLVKRWPALLAIILALVVDATSEMSAAVAAAAGGGAAVVQDGGVGVGGFRSLEPLLRCLQAVVRDPGLQGQLRRRHLGILRDTAGSLCAALSGSPLKDIVVQLRADICLLGGGGVNV